MSLMTRFCLPALLRELLPQTVTDIRTTELLRWLLALGVFVSEYEGNYIESKMVIMCCFVLSSPRCMCSDCSAFRLKLVKLMDFATCLTSGSFLIAPL